MMLVRIVAGGRHPLVLARQERAVARARPRVTALRLLLRV